MTRPAAGAALATALLASQLALAQEPAPTPSPEPGWVLALDEADARKGEIEELFERYSSAEGEERRLAWGRLLRRGSAYISELDAAMSLVLQEEQQGGDVAEARQRVAAHVEWTSELLERQIIGSAQLLRERRGQREGQAVDDLYLFEQEIAREMEAVDRLLAAFDAVLRWRQQLGLDTAIDERRLNDALRNRAEDLAGRAELVGEQRAELERLEAEAPPADLVDLQKVEQAMGVRFGALARSLTQTIALMEAQGLDTVVFRQALIKLTGDVTVAAIDQRVAVGLVEDWWAEAQEWLRRNGRRIALKLATFLAILLAFKVLSRILARVARRGMRASARVPKLLQNLGESIVANTTMLIGVLVALSHVGVEIGPMLASLGVVGFILGFALQDSLSNFAAGGMILVYQPFDVGDVIEAAGVKGKVHRLSLVSTTIHTFDNQKLIVPNRRIWGDVIRNVTAEPTRRVDLSFAVRYQEDVERALGALRAVAGADERVLDDPAPTVRLNSLDDGRAELILRPWVRTEDYWAARWDLLQAVKARLDADGIVIAAPQSEVRLQQ